MTAEVVDVSAPQRRGDTTRFTVRVAGRSFDVGISDSDAQRLAPDVETDVLVRESFAFLLEREPASSILARFDLPVITRYFPEYEGDIRRRLAP